MFWKLKTVVNGQFIPMFFKMFLYFCLTIHVLPVSLKQILIKNNYFKKTTWNNTDNNKLQHLPC